MQRPGAPAAQTVIDRYIEKLPADVQANIGHSCVEPYSTQAGVAWRLVIIWKDPDASCCYDTEVEGYTIRYDKL